VQGGWFRKCRVWRWARARSLEGKWFNIARNRDKRQRNGVKCGRYIINFTGKRAV